MRTYLVIECNGSTEIYSSFYDFTDISSLSMYCRSLHLWLLFLAPFQTTRYSSYSTSPIPMLRYESTWSFVKWRTIKTNLLFCPCTPCRPKIRDVTSLLFIIQSSCSFNSSLWSSVSHMQRFSSRTHATLAPRSQSNDPHQVTIFYQNNSLHCCHNANTFLAWRAPLTDFLISLCAFTDLPSFLIPAQN